MEQESKRAIKLGYEDPINPSYEATNAMYNAVFEYVLSRVPARPLGMTSVMMASHNEDSVRFAVQVNYLHTAEPVYSRLQRNKEYCLLKEKSIITGVE